ncbi:Hypothetical protein CINCED_3A001813 [Cinara cedri]|nr:Hypothetical protein CINCED_3A001813 [Cinara cedri]
MKGCRKCHAKLKVGDSLIYMKGVNKGAQKIMTAVPDQLMRLFTWIGLMFVFVFFFVMATYMVLGFELSPKSMLSSDKGIVSVPSTLYAQKSPVVENVTTREFCSTLFKNLDSLEHTGYVDTDRRVSKLLSLDIRVSDVHFVFMNTTHIPWLSSCSLESVLRNIGKNGRVNVFVISGIEFERPLYNGQQKIHPVSLTSSLAELTIKYGSDRLNVVDINLEECLECTPYQGMDLSKRPSMAIYVVQLVLLWQFGGTVLNPSVMAVHGEVYRMSDTAVTYSERTVSSPVACHAFIYDMILCARKYALYNDTYGLITARKMVESTVECISERIVDHHDKEVRTVANEVVYNNSVIGSHCYYLDVDLVRATYNANSYVYSFCPVVSQKTFS